MKYLVRSICSIALFLAVLSVQAQECEELSITVSSNIELGGPENFQLNIENEEGVSVVEFEAVAFGELSIEFLVACLDPSGCYSATVFFSAADNPEALEFEMETVMGAPVFPVNFYYHPEGEVLTFQFSFDNDCPFYDCPEEFFFDTEGDCGGIVAEIGSFVDGEEVQWTYGDGTVEIGGHFTDYMYEANGTYTLSAIYSSPTCLANYSGEITIDCFGTVCPEELTFEAMGDGCGAFLFSIPDVDQESTGIDWSVDGVVVEENVGPLFDYFFEEDGIHNVCAYMENEQCPDGVELCSEVEVDCDPCGLQVEVNSSECGPFVFTSSTVDATAPVFWWVDDNEELTEGSSFTFEPTEPGVYIICAGIETEDCPLGNFVCTTLEVSENCFGNACPEVLWSGDGEQCGEVSLEIGSFQEGELVVWTFGDGSTETGGHFITHTYAENGVYEVCGVFTSNDCPDGVTVCAEVVVDCFEVDCFPNIELQTLACNSWLFVADEPDVEWWGWYVNGELLEDNVATFDYEAAGPGYYSICLEYQNEACGLVTICYEVTVFDDCFDEMCSLDVDLTSDPECGPYVFIAESGEEEGPIYWWVEGTEISSEGPAFTFMPEQAGTYVVCVTNESPNCPFGAQECFEINVPESCFEQPCAGELEWENASETCGELVFWVPGLDDEDEVNWYIQDVLFEGGAELLYTFEEDGLYELCALYYTPDCPDGIEACVSVEISCDEPECTPVSLGFDLANENVELDALDWSVYDSENNLIASNECSYNEGIWCDATACLGEGCHTLYFNFYPALTSVEDLGFFGSYGEEEYIVFNSIFWAEDLSEATFEISVDGSCGEVAEECPTEEDFYQGALADCGWMEFEIGSFAEGELVIWDFGDGVTFTGGHYVQHEYPTRRFVRSMRLLHLQRLPRGRRNLPRS